MIVRALDENHDWTFGQSLNNYLSGNTALAQNLDTRIQSFLGDCFFALTAGIDWWNLLGSKNQVAINLAVSAVILNTYGVVKLTQLDIVLGLDRNLTISYTVDTIFGGRLTRNIGLILLTTQQGDFLTDQQGNILSA